MRISEIFFTVQGEGRYLGHPSIFIRSSGCNLRCIWCDTPYTSWEPIGERKTVHEILQETQQWQKVKHVVITGGEPMIQKDLPELVEALQKRGHFITIETAGTVYDERVKPDFFSVSPKLKNSEPTGFTKELHLHQKNNQHSSLEKFRNASCEKQFKFVVVGTGDLSQIQTLVKKYEIEREDVYLMPEGKTPEELQEKSEQIVEICKETGFIMTPRMHVNIWGDRRGV